MLVIVDVLRLYETDLSLIFAARMAATSPRSTREICRTLGIMWCTKHSALGAPQVWPMRLFPPGMVDGK